jgi:hypothetical protein
MYKNNSGLIAKTKVSNIKKGLYLTEKLACKTPLLCLFENVTQHLLLYSSVESKTRNRFNLFKLTR